MSVESNKTINNTGCLTMCKITSLLEYILFSSDVVCNFISVISNMTINAERITEIEVSWKVAPYPNISAMTPPNKGPIKFPVILPVCKVPSTLPATFSGVCVAIRACDMGINPVNIPINNRKTKSCQTEVANPIKKIETPRPLAKKINNFFLPYLSPTRPHKGANKKAATQVIPNVQPAQLCTYASE